MVRNFGKFTNFRFVGSLKHYYTAKPVGFVFDVGQNNLFELDFFVEGVHGHLEISVVAPMVSPRVSTMPVRDVSSFAVIEENIFRDPPPYDADGVATDVVRLVKRL